MGENEGKGAEEIFKEFREHSVAEFFKKNRQMLGFSGSVRSLTTIIHEYVTNSLDACEEGGILPDINIRVKVVEENGHVIISIRDNGPGIPREHIGKALGAMLAGTKFHRYMQQRGQQGIGASGCTMFAQITTGKPVHVKSGTGNGMAYECDISTDFKTNAANVTNLKEYREDFRGLEVTGEFSEVKYDRSEHSVYEYLKRTAIANPHAKIVLVEPDGNRVVFQRAVEVVPERPTLVQPHPLGLTTNDLMEFSHHSKARKLASFFMQEFVRFSDAKVKELQDLLPHINMNKHPQELRWDEAEQIVKAIQKLKWIAPATDSLRPIGAEHIQKALENILKPEFIEVSDRKPKIYRGGVPFIVEVGIAYGGNAGRKKIDGTNTGDLSRFANRAPLLFDTGGCAITEAVKTVDWKRYDVKDFENEPITVFVNFVSVHVPYTGAGKQAISAEEEILEEMRFAIMDVARRIQLHVRGKRRDFEREAKRKAIIKYVERIVIDLSDLSRYKDSNELERRLKYLIDTKYSKALFDEEEAGHTWEQYNEKLDEMEDEENEKEERIREKVEALKEESLAKADEKAEKLEKKKKN